MPKKTRSKKRARKGTMRGGMSPVEIGLIGAGVAGVTALLYSYLSKPSEPLPPDYSNYDVRNGLPFGTNTANV